MSSLSILHGCATVQLTQGQNTLIDERDAEWIRESKWCATWREDNASFYVVSYVRGGHPGQMQLMHRAILERLESPEPRARGDHKNRDTLDNRRDNLRWATGSQNRCNAAKKRWKGQASSQYKGVKWAKRNSKWLATITKDGKQKYLGLYLDETAAARAYNVAATEMFGEFARINEGV